jgi:hypothetical protein
LDHFCHHLVYFHKTNSFSYLYIKNICFGKSRDLSRVNLIKYHKLPLFPIIEIIPHKRTFFYNKRVLIKHKDSNSTFFEISQVVG